MGFVQKLERERRGLKRKQEEVGLEEMRSRGEVVVVVTVVVVKAKLFSIFG